MLKKPLIRPDTIPAADAVIQLLLIQTFLAKKKKYIDNTISAAPSSLIATVLSTENKLVRPTLIPINAKIVGRTSILKLIYLKYLTETQAKPAMHDAVVIIMLSVTELIRGNNAMVMIAKPKPLDACTTPPKKTIKPAIIYVSNCLPYVSVYTYIARYAKPF